MSVQAVLVPVFIQVALTLGLLWWTGRSRFAVIKSGEIRPEQIALGEPAWPAKPTRIANAYHNQFHLPVLFYVAVLFALATNATSTLFVVLEWAFVLSRLWHAYIHTTSNNLVWRFRAFFVGFAVLIVMWLMIALHVLIA